MNVLVITDNTFLWGEFKKITGTSLFNDVHFDYACSESSVEMFKNAAGINLPTVKVKADYPEIIAKYDLVISMHCKQIFPKEMVGNVRCVNIHPGLNPYNRGWYPQVFAILNKLPHGATIHEIDAELDHGAIIAQEPVPVYEWDTSRSVYERVQQAELSLIAKNLRRILDNSYTAKIPAMEGNVNLIKDFRALCELNMDEKISMREAIDRLRALTHEPYSNAYFLTDSGEKVFVKIQFTRTAPGN